MDDFMLPHELMDGARIPDGLRDRVGYQIVCAKYLAFVEQVMHLTGGEPVEVSAERVKEIVAFTHLTDPREVVMVKEETDEPGADIYRVSLATVEEIQAANRRYALSRMGARRN